MLSASKIAAVYIFPWKRSNERFKTWALVTGFKGPVIKERKQDEQPSPTFGSTL